MSWRTDARDRRAYYAKTVAATISRRELGSERQRVEPPADVERREFNGPCFLCGERGQCKHRISYANPAEAAS